MSHFSESIIDGRNLRLLEGTFDGGVAGPIALTNATGITDEALNRHFIRSTSVPPGQPANVGYEWASVQYWNTASYFLQVRDDSDGSILTQKWIKHEGGGSAFDLANYFPVEPGDGILKQEVIFGGSGGTHGFRFKWIPVGSNNKTYRLLLYAYIPSQVKGNIIVESGLLSAHAFPVPMSAVPSSSSSNYITVDSNRLYVNAIQPYPEKPDYWFELTHPDSLTEILAAGPLTPSVDFSNSIPASYGVSGQGVLHARWGYHSGFDDKGPFDVQFYWQKFAQSNKNVKLRVFNYSAKKEPSLEIPMVESENISGDVNWDKIAYGTGYYWFDDIFTIEGKNLYIKSDHSSVIYRLWLELKNSNTNKIIGSGWLEWGGPVSSGNSSSIARYKTEEGDLLLTLTQSTPENPLSSNGEFTKNLTANFNKTGTDNVNIKIYSDYYF